VGGGGSGGVGEGAGGVAIGFAELDDVVVVGAGTGCAELSAHASSAKSAVVAPPSTTTVRTANTADRLVVVFRGVAFAGAAGVARAMSIIGSEPIKEARRLLRNATGAR